MDYFYAPPQAITSEMITIEGEEFSHLTHVMRKKIGDEFRIVDGNGMAYDCFLEYIGKRQAQCRIAGRHHMLHEPTRSVTLAVGMLKNNSSFDFLIEKCTELGVAEIIPVRTSRTIPVHAKTTRWRKLALAAMKQCGRCILPVIREPVPLTDYLQHTKATVRFLPHEKVDAPSLREVDSADTQGTATLLIGPEGGFSDDEIAAAVSVGFIPVSLGRRRLRTETAAIHAVGVVVRDA